MILTKLLQKRIQSNLHNHQQMILGPGQNKNISVLFFDDNEYAISRNDDGSPQQQQQHNKEISSSIRFKTQLSESSLKKLLLNDYNIDPTQYGCSDFVSAFFNIHPNSFFLNNHGNLDVYSYFLKLHKIHNFESKFFRKETYRFSHIIEAITSEKIRHVLEQRQHQSDIMRQLFACFFKINLVIFTKNNRVKTYFFGKYHTFDTLIALVEENNKYHFVLKNNAFHSIPCCSNIDMFFRDDLLNKNILHLIVSREIKETYLKKKKVSELRAMCIKKEISFLEPETKKKIKKNLLITKLLTY